MEIRVIMYINLFLQGGYAVGLSVVAFHNRRFRQFFWFAAAYFIGAVSTVLRTRPEHIPQFFTLVLSNVLVVIALLIIYRRFTSFVNARTDTRWIEATILAGTFLAMSYYSLVRPSFPARSLIMTLTFLAMAVLSAYVLIRHADSTVRASCFATAALYIVFSLMLIIHAIWVTLPGKQHDFFEYSIAHLLGFLGFDVLIAGLPLGYFWMTSARLYANQEQLARTDSLTGLPNRRALQEFALREMERSRRNGASMAVLAIDIDHFKSINDKYGHDAGDIALGAVANALAEALRGNDILARLGGEEFVALLPGADKEEAAAVAERLRKIVESCEISSERRLIRATASFGIALCREDDTFETVMRRADAALYAAKLAGRNLVMPESDLLYLFNAEASHAYNRPFDTTH